MFPIKEDNKHFSQRLFSQGVYSIYKPWVFWLRLFLLYILSYWCKELLMQILRKKTFDNIGMLFIITDLKGALHSSLVKLSVRQESAITSTFKFGNMLMKYYNFINVFSCRSHGTKVSYWDFCFSSCFSKLASENENNEIHIHYFIVRCQLLISYLLYFWKYPYQNFRNSFRLVLW